MDELQHLDTGRAWRAGQWLCDEALEPMHEINARCLDVLRTMSQQTTTGAAQPSATIEQQAAWGTRL